MFGSMREHPSNFPTIPFVLQLIVLTDVLDNALLALGVNPDQHIIPLVSLSTVPFGLLAVGVFWLNARMEWRQSTRYVLALAAVGTVVWLVASLVGGTAY